MPGGLDSFIIPDGVRSMEESLGKHKNWVRIADGEVIADARFPLDMSNAHHYERLKSYWLSYSSIVVQYTVIACVCFIAELTISLLTGICFNNNVLKCVRNRKRKSDDIWIFWSALLTNVLFVMSVLLSTVFAWQIFAGLPNYNNEITEFIGLATKSFKNMTDGINFLSSKRLELQASIEACSELFKIGNSAMRYIGLNTENSSYFDTVRLLFNNSVALEQSIRRSLASKNLVRIYKTFVDPVLPASRKCNDTCLNWMRTYNRNDVFKEQLDHVFQCHGVYGSCLDRFETKTRNFLKYLVYVEEMAMQAVADLDEWEDTIKPSLELLFNTKFKVFLNTLSSEVAPFFDTEFTKKVMPVEMGIMVMALVSAACFLTTISWLVTPSCPVVVASVANAITVIVFSAQCSYLMSYVLFMKETIVNFDMQFSESHYNANKLYYNLVLCSEGSIGYSSELDRFTSGKEFAISEAMKIMDEDVLGEIYDRSSDIISPIPFFGIKIDDNQLYPYYEIDDDIYNQIYDKNIANDAVFLPLSSLFDEDIDAVENNIIQSNIDGDEEFATAYNAVFGSEGSPCHDYRLTDINKCQIEDSHSSSHHYNFLVSHKVTTMLRDNITDIHNFLMVFSKHGDIYNEELMLVNNMSLIIKNYLYQISNTLARAYETASNTYVSHENFIMSSLFQDSLYAAKQVVNSTCTGMNRWYNSFRKRLMVTIPGQCRLLYVSLYVVLFSPIFVSVANFLFKARFGNREPETDFSSSSGYSQSAHSGKLKADDTSSSSESTFGNDEAVNTIPGAPGDDNTSSSSETDTEALPEPAPALPPAPELDLSVPSYVLTGEP